MKVELCEDCQAKIEKALKDSPSVLAIYICEFCLTIIGSTGFRPAYCPECQRKLKE